MAQHRRGTCRRRISSAGIGPPCAQKMVQCESYWNGMELLRCGVGGAAFALTIAQAAAVKKYKKWDNAS
jgi:hypothetical protein